MPQTDGPVSTRLQEQLGAQPITGDLLEVCCNTVDKLLAEPTESSRPGMLLGKIQSGKTKAFIGVLALAFDNGYNHAVVFTKGTCAMTRKTVARLRKDLRLAIDQELAYVHDIMSLPPTLSPWELERKLVFVCKKEDDNLNALTDVLTQQYPVTSPSISPSSFSSRDCNTIKARPKRGSLAGPSGSGPRGSAIR